MSSCVLAPCLALGALRFGREYGIRLTATEIHQLFDGSEYVQPHLVVPA